MIETKERKKKEKRKKKLKEEEEEEEEENRRRREEELKTFRNLKLLFDGTPTLFLPEKCWRENNYNVIQIHAVGVFVCFQLRK